MVGAYRNGVHGMCLIWGKDATDEEEQDINACFVFSMRHAGVVLFGY